MAEFKIIETQEQLDAIISERIGRERGKLEQKFSAYLSPDDFKSKTQTLNDQIAGLNTKLSEADAKYKDLEKTIAEKDALIKKHETASVKSRIAHEMGLSYEAISFIQGDDEETIKSSAEALKTLVGSKIMPMGDPDPIVEKDKDETKAYKEMLKGLNLNN